MNPFWCYFAGLSFLAATCPVTMFPHFSIKYSLNTIQNAHKEVHFTKCCVNKKKVVSTFNLGKNFLYIFPMFVFDKYWVNFAKVFSIKFDKLFNHISPNQDTTPVLMAKET